jgi:L-asparaginase/Glu-tRNA(Gln) amidotransferase subunit D
VCLIATGGTVASTGRPGAVTAAPSAEELLARLRVHEPGSGDDDPVTSHRLAGR